LEEYISFYKSLGFSIIPLLYKSKRPLVPWKEYQKRQPTDAEITSWFRGQPRNIGIVTGSVSANLTVLDFDDESSYYKFFIKREELEKTTLTVKPSRGLHLYLRNDRPIRSFKISKLKLDIKAEGGFVVAPPSIHPRGHVYHFINCEVKGVALVSDLESMIWARASELGVKKRVLTPTEHKLGVGKACYRGEHPVCIRKLLRGVKLGERDEVAVRLAGYFHVERGLTEDETLKKLLNWNQRNHPPIGEYSGDPSDVKGYFLEKIRSAEKMEGRFGCESLFRFSGICSGKENCEYFRFYRKRRKEKWSITISRSM